ncbi:DUF6067 family protein [Fulvivirgaceae bacterium BMA10]|uniref:DUF6067 family protein n=1 Tax=Splendidivirga corallicola TaxID=3051826 RepID=A0ABT8KNU5_9BACT|nr:DUF6067 family protein [Fulvivirgaceae bacterium BMA10]
MIHLKKTFYLIAILLASCSQEKTGTINFREKDTSASNYEVFYESGNWDHPNYSKAFEFYGNQRAVIELPDQIAGNAQVIIPWRRRDNNPAEKDIIIVDTKTNTVVENRYILEINNEYGHLIFEPNNQSSLYYVYFLPHKSAGSYYPKLTYKKPTETQDKTWLSEIKLGNNEIADLPKAKVISIQSIDDFHSFFPMEVIATQEEVSKFIENNAKPYYLFPEYREYPIRLTDYLPVRWIADTVEVNGISDSVFKGEFYSFQIGVFSPKENLQDISIDFTDFESESGNRISKEMITCFNKGGIDLNGNSFDKEVSVTSGKTQALWFGIEIPEEIKKDSYMGNVIIEPKGFAADTVFVKLKVSSDKITNYGDDTPKNMSRLRWLNSTIGTDKDFIIKPYEPVKISNKKISILGREIMLNEYGFPENILSYFTPEMTGLKESSEPILARPIRFDVVDENGHSTQWEPNSYVIQQTYKSVANWTSNVSSDDFIMNVSGTLEYDGMLDYKIKVIAKKDIGVKDIKLQIPMQKEAAKYILGLGQKGGKFKNSISWKWDVTKHQEGAWLGNINKGIQYVLRDENYSRPLNTNFYQAKPLNLPNSWFNENKGGINITAKNDVVNVENYTGARKIKKGDTLNFNIRFLITPFKPIDIKEHFNTRFVHKYVPVDSVVDMSGTIINIHHANDINPYINYPFYNVDKQKAYIEEAHSKGIRVKLYNTIRELSYKSHELFALKSLGDEILNDGQGGGHSWLQEHFKSNYHSAWHATSVNDASILNKGNSRWTNYYVEGINWLAKNNKIDGLYLDDIAFSRTTVKRMVSVINKHRDSFVIDLHSANQFRHDDGFINSAFLYMEHFPFISRLWFGEYFEYDLAPDYWLTEVSGIPFGLTGEMLEKGGHPYRGLVFGMTTRVYHIYSPQALWKLFNEFDIANSEMLGYWVDKSPIKTNTKNIKSTIYLNQDKILIAIGSWSAEDESVALEIDWKTLGIDKKSARLISPEIKGLQNFNTFEINTPITIGKNNGLILILETKK